VLSQLRQRCAASVLRSAPGVEVSIRLSFGVGGGRRRPERTAIFRLTHAAGLKRAEVLPSSDGVRVVFVEDYPPTLDHPGMPEALHPHAMALAEALRGHHERAVAFFRMLCEQHLGATVSSAIERGEPMRGFAGGDAEALAIYPEVPRLVGT
jgi:acetyl esterase/lipase